MLCPTTHLDVEVSECDHDHFCPNCHLTIEPDPFGVEEHNRADPAPHARPRFRGKADKEQSQRESINSDRPL